MSLKKWNVSYTGRNNKHGETIIEWPEEPSKEETAIHIRRHLLGDNFLLVDTPRNHPEPTVFLLRSYGFEIVTIEEVSDQSFL